MIHVEGVVQGVGFRPYIYALAQEHHLSGYVCNDTRGAVIAIEGDSHTVHTFVEHLEQGLPPLARIDRIDIAEVAWIGYEGFEIRQSNTEYSRSAAVAPDMAVCDNCLSEMRDPQNRRFGYWFINCTDCGPRYSITRTVPYDRPNTSMESFALCQACAEEYHDPENRRYHAQPISCYACGPQLHYQDAQSASANEAALEATVKALQEGTIVAVQGLGGFHLMCDARNEPTVRLLRQRKQRLTKPLAVMFPTLEAIRDAAEVSEAEAALIASKEKPIVLVRSKPSTIAASVAPGIDRIGVFLPYTPVHHRLMDALQFPLVATSANLSDEPIIRRCETLQARLGDVFDAVLSHDREIVNACDDSVLQLVGEQPLMLRMARGYAPYTLTLPNVAKRSVVAVGANQKNSIALAFDGHLVLSPHIGDLNSLEAFEYFERTLETFKRFYGFQPELIVCDQHPEYETTKWAEAQNLPLLRVQHHYAHILAVMAEYGLEEQVLGFAFDGTGYGDDGTIWGGEVFLADTNNYERVFSLAPFRLLGGEKAVREPRRVALGMLFECYELEEVLALKIPTVEAFTEEEMRLLHSAWRKGLNAPVTSSMGRVFDAVASLSGICQQVTYEGESGLKLEATVCGDVEPYGVLLVEGQMVWHGMLRQMVEEEHPEVIPSRFMATIVDVVVRIALQYDRRIVFSGGVFQNRTLLTKLQARLEGEGVDYCIPSKFPVNDGGIALGQMYKALQLG